MNIKLQKYLPVVPILIIVVSWELLASSSSDFLFKYGSPSSIVNRFAELLFVESFIKRYNIYYSFILTLVESLLGFVIGNLVGTFLGLTLWYFKRLAIVSKPYLIALGSIPIFALAPLMILWFGTGLMAKVYMAAFSVVIVAIIQAYEGAQNVSKEYMNYFISLKASRWQILRKLIVPGSINWVLNSYKINIGFAIIGAFIGEWISSEHGIGHMILAASGLYDVPMIFVGLLCLMLISIIINFLVQLFERKFFKHLVIKE